MTKNKNITMKVKITLLKKKSKNTTIVLKLININQITKKKNLK